MITHPPIDRFLIVLFGITLLPLSAFAGAGEFIGNWAIKMNNSDAGWLTLEVVDNQFTGQLWSVGQSKNLADFDFANNELTFTRNLRVGNPEFPGGPPTGDRVPCSHTATVDGDTITLVTTLPDQSTLTHTGKRLPPLPDAPDLSQVKFGEPVSLFNGTDLSGWKLSNPEQRNGWKAADGILVNETPKETFDPFSRYGNLRTEGVFGDGKLEIEFNVPPGGNSGIYVRGAYEAQVVDRDSRMQGIQGVGAIFGRIEPTKMAGKVGGEWQKYEITIVDRHATVILNGETVIDNQPIIGNTMGAYQSDITSPGPLYLQGDHTSVQYRNIFFHPVVD